MKKIILLTVALLSAVILPAQGIYQLWGMTPRGGTNDLGIIFNTDAAGNNFQLKHQFDLPGIPGGRLGELTEFNGKFYGMGYNNGNDYNGAIIEWDPLTNKYTKKIDFDSSNGSFFGNTGLTLKDGKFYGMTYAGGTHNRGVIFTWDPAANIYTKKFDFSDSINGIRPKGRLSFSSGKFYGITSMGGSYDASAHNPYGGGVIFEWDPVTGIYTKKFDFEVVNGHSSNGHYPVGITLKDGKFYGTAAEGGGTWNDAPVGGFDSGTGVIFEWNPLTNVYTKKIDFTNDLNNSTDGSRPGCNLTLKGDKFYSTTLSGGTNNLGVIFEWDAAANVYTKKIDLDNLNGYYMFGNNLTESGDKLYGITPRGGTNSLGVIFEYDPVSNVYVKKLDFDNINGTGNYEQTLTPKDGKLYGATEGGIYNNGLIFELDPITNVYTKKIDFFGLAYKAAGSLTAAAGKLYGRLGGGGSGALGVIFEFNPTTTSYLNKKSFGSNTSTGSVKDNESTPVGNLAFNNGKFYGMTAGGISWNYQGSIFVWDATVNIYNNKKFFRRMDPDGSNPRGSLILNGGKYYGITSAGGANINAGVIFEWEPAANIFTKKINFNSSPGGISPYGSMALNNGKFYGMTSGGGTNNAGVIYEWDPVTNIYTKKIDFNGSDGSKPTGSLTLKDGKFYGMTSAGGANDKGVIFEWNPTSNVYTKKIDFNGTNGSNPGGSLTLSGSRFYGLTSSGGTSDAGVFFEWDPASNVYTTKEVFTGSNGSKPAYDNGLSVVAVPVSNGLPGSCTTFPTVTIDNSNNNQWVSITDNDGNAVAEIKANGNNLGVVTASLFINNSAVREDGSKKLYLDRNIALTPEVQPTTPVDIRLYIKNSEYLALKNATNSNGQSSGISTINDISIYKVDGDCSATLAALTNPVASSISDWEGDYVLSSSVTSFSSFYFAVKSSNCPAPVISEVRISKDMLWPPFHSLRKISISYRTTSNSTKCGVVTNWLTVKSNELESGTGNRDVSPDWIITDQHHLKLRAERDDHGTGRIYTITIHSKNEAGLTSTHDVHVTVPLQMVTTYSRGIQDDSEDYIDESLNCKVTPNPSSQNFNLQIASASNEKIEVNISDMSGRRIAKLNAVKNKTLRFGENLQPGVYMVAIVQGEQRQVIKIIKQ